jgi:glycosyltransferase involved in cell wall biosynthesis
MKVFMLGWEFPPFISGGLGTACYGLTKAMSEIGTEVQFVLPRPISDQYSTHVRMMAPRAGSSHTTDTFVLDEFERVTFRAVAARMSPYVQPGVRETAGTTKTSTVVGGSGNGTDGGGADDPVAGFVGASGHYAGDMFVEISRYARLAAAIAANEHFDVIHAHDWMTYPAGRAVARLTGRPLVVHIHSTEFDRSGKHVNQAIYDIERAGFEAASRIIAVSYLTRNILTSRYGVNPDKIDVVYNAVEFNGHRDTPAVTPIRRDEKIVLFLGRITMQKGPEYFLAAAKRVLEVMDNVRFIMAGSGDMIRRTIELAAEMGIGHKVLFTGFLRGDDVARVFRMADLYVMPSVSEPFGIAPLEAISHDVPALISKQSGVAEVDFWDTEEMANKIAAVLRHPPLHATLREHGGFEVGRMSWQDSARQCLAVYGRVMHRA